MSIEAVGAVMRCGPMFDSGHKAVLLALVNFVDEDGRCYPSVPEIAWLTGMSERNVRRMVLDLEDLALIRIVEKGGGRRANTYAVALDWLEKAARAIANAKKKALQEGVDRYKAMKIVAKEWREHLYQHMHADPERGPRWRERHKPVEKPAQKHVTPDIVSGVRGDTMSGVEPEKKFEDVSDVTPALTNEPSALTPCQGSPDASVTLTVIDPLNNPSVERGALAEKSDTAREHDPPPPDRRLENGGRDEPPERKPRDVVRVDPTETREAIRRVQELAQAMGRTQHALCLDLGSLSLADKLARQWKAGEVDLNEVQACIDRQNAEESEAVA